MSVGGPKLAELISRHGYWGSLLSGKNVHSNACSFFFFFMLLDIHLSDQNSVLLPL